MCLEQNKSCLPARIIREDEPRVVVMGPAKAQRCRILFGSL